MAQRTDLTLAQKIKLLDDVALQPPGISQRQRAELLSIPRTTLIRLTNEKSSQVKMVTYHESSQKTTN